MTINNLSELTQDTLKKFQEAAKSTNAQDFTKDASTAGISQSTGLVWYDLQAPAKNLFPVLTPLRNSIPRVSGNGGTATNWKAVTVINANKLQGFVPEGRRNGVVITTEVDKAASYKTIEMEDSVTFEAERAAQNFENIRATTAQRLLWATMISEELAILGANNSLALGSVAAVTVSGSAAGGTITSGSYNVYCVPLTLQGYQAASVSSTGVPNAVTVTSADGGANITYGGGNGGSGVSGSCAVSGTGTNSITAHVTVVNGASAYAWYLGASGSEVIAAITTINSVSLTANPSASNQNISAVTTDQSKNAYAFDGMLIQAYTANSGAYVKHLATGTDGTGSTLTSDSAAGIVEIDAMLKDRWDNYRLPFTKLYVSSQIVSDLTKKVVASGGAPLFRLTANAESGLNNIMGGTVIGSYLNKFSANGGTIIPIVLHPNMPPGTLMGVAETLPYPINNVPNVVEMKIRRDYYQIEWPLRSRKYETAVEVDEVLAVYFPAAIGIIDNIAAG